MLLQRLGSLLWRRFNPWPRNLPTPLERPHSTSCVKAAPREHAGGVSGVGLPLISGSHELVLISGFNIITKCFHVRGLRDLETIRAGDRRSALAGKVTRLCDRQALCGDGTGQDGHALWLECPGVQGLGGEGFGPWHSPRIPWGGYLL